MKSEEWSKETRRRAGLVARFFEPEENILIQGFINAAEKDGLLILDFSKEKGDQNGKAKS